MNILKSELIKKIENQNKLNVSVESGCGCTDLDPCGTPNCDLAIDVCCIIPIPRGFSVEDGPTVNAAVSTECLSCFEEICSAPGCVTDPCGTGQFLCDVPVKRLRVHGSMTVIASVSARPIRGQFQLDPQLCCCTTVCVDRVVCVRCLDTDLCASYRVDDVVINLSASVVPDGCNGHVLVTGTISLAPCPEPPPPSCSF